MLVNGSRCHRGLFHNGEHVCRLDVALFQIPYIDGMNPVDEVPVPLVGGIEVMPKAAIDEYVDHVTETNEDLEMKSLDEQWQDILRADTLKSSS